MGQPQKCFWNGSTIDKAHALSALMRLIPHPYIPWPIRRIHVRPWGRPPTPKDHPGWVRREPSLELINISLDTHTYTHTHTHLEHHVKVELQVVVRPVCVRVCVCACVRVCVCVLRVVVRPVRARARACLCGTFLEPSPEVGN